MTTTRIHEDVFCRRCGKQLDTNTAVEEGAQPKPDDISICGYCGTLSLYSEDLRLRAPTPEERLELQRSPAWDMIARAINNPPLRHVKG